MSGQVDDQELYDNHVLSVCAALGGLEPLGTGSSELVYVPGDEALACLRDLKRFLRRAEQQRDRRVHHLLRKWHIVQKDLLPMLVASIRNDQLKIASTICELLVPLTWPFDAEGQLAYHDELKEYQEAFLQQDVFASILAVMVHLFSIPHGLRHERDHARLRLLLCLFRNLLAFFDTQVSVTASAEVQWRSILQEQLVTRLYSDGVVDLLMSLCGSLGESEFDGWNTLLVEIFYYMFQRRDISVLLSSDRQGSQLEQLLKKEKASVSTAGRPRTTRHARFGGTFSVALPNGTMVNTRKVAAVASSSADVLPMAAPRLKRTQKDMPSKIPIETPQAQKAFSAIAIQFVKECFNDLAVSMKRDIDRERIFLKPQDTVRFIWLCQFGLELRRDACRTGTMIGLDSILGVLNTPNIVFTLRRLSASRDEKSPVETTFCLKFLNQLLLAIEEMMHQTGDAGMFDVATQLISTLFYEHDNALLLRSLCKESRAHSKSYLETLVACIDTLLGVTERVLAEQGMLVTRKKARARTSKAPTSAADDGNGTGIGVDGDSTLLASAPAVQQPTGDDASDAEDNEQPRYVEQAFDFRSYMAGFATDGTVATYCQLLRFYPDLENETVEQIVRMLRRLFQDHGCQESFYKLSVMELFGQIANARGAGQASTSGLHKELLSFVALVVGTFVEQVSSNAESGPLALLKIVFGGIRSDKELSLANSDDDVDAIHENIGDTPFGQALYAFWKGTAIKEDIKLMLLQEFSNAVQAALAEDNRGSVALSEMALKLFQTSDEVQLLVESGRLVVDQGTIKLPSDWSIQDLQAAATTISYLQSRKRAKPARSKGGRKKAKATHGDGRVDKQQSILSAQFVEEDSDDEEAEAAFYRREAEIRQRNSAAVSVSLPGQSALSNAMAAKKATAIAAEEDEAEAAPSDQTTDHSDSD